ncbi:MAG: ligase-associated DNA damage response endonuclease PdeM [Bdellovibrionota bacterium]
MTTIELHGDTFDLLPERCAFHREAKTILCSDLHWGKAESMQRRGLAIPASHMFADLARLKTAIDRTKAKRVLILGDLIHHPNVLREPLLSEIAAWRRSINDTHLAVVRGNHDRQHPWPIEWKIEDLGTSLTEGNFIFSHDKVESKDHFVWTGHVHPMIHLHGNGDHLRLACFLIGKSEAVLPAFTSLAGGADIKKNPRERVFAIADSDVIEV